MHALILDADLRAAHAVSLMLQAAGISVDRAGLAAQALELGRRHSYDLLLLDLILPDLSGRQLVRRMRAACVGRPMLVMSRLPQARSTALDAGADGFLQKPFGRSELMARIRRLLPRAGKNAEDAPLDGAENIVALPRAARVGSEFRSRVMAEAIQSTG